MARVRDYKAEYAARQARSLREYGVSYGQQRRAVERGRAQGVAANKIRETFREVKTTAGAPAALAKLIAQRAQASAAYRRGENNPSSYIDYDAYDAYDFDDEWFYYH